MKIHVYAVCYNEADLLPYFLRHYETFADEIVVFDGGSTDGSQDILFPHPRVNLVELEHKEYDEMKLMEIRNKSYKASLGKADWVMVVDIDEFIYCKDLIAELEDLDRKNIYVIQSPGYEMFSDQFPVTDGQIYSVVKNGVENRYYSKCAVFRPEVNIRYSIGCHSSDPGCKVRFNPRVSLLHFRFIGREFFINKYFTRMNRCSSDSLWRGMGEYRFFPNTKTYRLYGASREELGAIYDEIFSNATLTKVIE